MLVSTDDSNYQEIAAAIREKLGGKGTYTPPEMADAIRTIETGVDTDDATAKAADILADKTAYAKGVKLTGTIPTNKASDLTASGARVTVPAGYYASNVSKSVDTATLATPVITVAANGRVSASVTQAAGGYVAVGTRTGTYQLATVAGQTITPGTQEQRIPAERWTAGLILIAGDEDLLPENILRGVTIFGVTGTARIDSRGATATADDIRAGKTAWADGEELTGTIPDVERAVPVITAGTLTGLITAKTAQAGGYVTEGEETATLQLPTRAREEYLPGAEDIIIPPGTFLIGEQVILGDAALLPDNIAWGVSIFGVVGTNGRFQINLMRWPLERLTAGAGDVVGAADSTVGPYNVDTLTWDDGYLEIEGETVVDAVTAYAGPYSVVVIDTE